MSKTNKKLNFLYIVVTALKSRLMLNLGFKLGILFRNLSVTT